MIGKKENTLPYNVAIDRRNLVRGVIKSYTPIGLRISRHDAAEVYSPEGHRHAEANPTCEIHKDCCASHRDQHPSLGYICPGEPHERSPQRSKNLRIGLRRRQSGKNKVPAKQRGSWPEECIKLQEQQRATFFSPSENWCLPASTLKPEEREFVVDSGASTKSCSPTIVITANGEVQTHEEAIVYVKGLGIFLTMKVLENTPAVSSLGKLCDDNGYSYE